MNGIHINQISRKMFIIWMLASLRNDLYKRKKSETRSNAIGVRHCSLNHRRTTTKCIRKAIMCICRWSFMNHFRGWHNKWLLTCRDIPLLIHFRYLRRPKFFKIDGSAITWESMHLVVIVWELLFVALSFFHYTRIPIIVFILKSTLI